MQQLLEIMRRLRRECPWDARQTHQSLKRYLLEECYETIEAIDANDMNELKKELGDILLQVVFHSAIAEENAHFTFEDVVAAISRKMVERHPHVFEKERGITAHQVQENWEKHKHASEERRSLLEGVPLALPALLRAQRLQEKAAAIGFDWPDARSVWEKLDEEWQEVHQAREQETEQAEAEELGDLMFTLVNYTRKKGWNAEELLQKANLKFLKRFNHMEKALDYNTERLHNTDLDTLNRLWETAKKDTE